MKKQQPANKKPTYPVSGDVILQLGWHEVHEYNVYQRGKCYSCTNEKLNYLILRGIKFCISKNSTPFLVICKQKYIIRAIRNSRENYNHAWDEGYAWNTAAYKSDPSFTVKILLIEYTWQVYSDFCIKKNDNSTEQCYPWACEQRCQTTALSFIASTGVWMGILYIYVCVYILDRVYTFLGILRQILMRNLPERNYVSVTHVP